MSAAVTPPDPLAALLGPLRTATLHPRQLEALRLTEQCRHGVAASICTGCPPREVDWLFGLHSYVYHLLCDQRSAGEQVGDSYDIARHRQLNDQAWVAREMLALAEVAMAPLVAALTTLARERDEAVAQLARWETLADHPALVELTGDGPLADVTKALDALPDFVRLTLDLTSKLGETHDALEAAEARLAGGAASVAQEHTCDDCDKPLAPPDTVCGMCMAKYPPTDPELVAALCSEDAETEGTPAAAEVEPGDATADGPAPHPDETVADFRARVELGNENARKLVAKMRRASRPLYEETPRAVPLVDAADLASLRADRAALKAWGAAINEKRLELAHENECRCRALALAAQGRGSEKDPTGA